MNTELKIEPREGKEIVATLLISENGCTGKMLMRVLMLEYGEEISIRKGGNMAVVERPI